MNKKYRGAHSELTACSWLISQGYEVFRNVSNHGPADIVAIKDGKCFLFDVKTGCVTTVTQEQHDLGIGLINVLHDGNCVIRKAKYVRRLIPAA
jgi:Holliday junction resolvase